MSIPNFTRKRNRLPFKEVYHGGNWYFITICILEKAEILSKIVKPKEVEDFTKVAAMPSSPYLESILNYSFAGKLVKKAWLDNLKFYKNIVIDEYVIMPNHFHAIIGLNLKQNYSLGQVIKGFKRKSLLYLKQYLNKENGDEGIAATDYLRLESDNNQIVSKVNKILLKYKTIWQKSFYDHIIRNEESLAQIRKYIFYNPLNWHLDSLNPAQNKV